MSAGGTHILLGELSLSVRVCFLCEAVEMKAMASQGMEVCWGKWEEPAAVLEDTF